VEAGAVLGAFLFAPTGSVNDAVILLTGLTMSAVLLGTTQRAQQQYLTALEDRATQLERERNHKAIIAAAEERTRIAREIHDIVAHSVSVMIALSEGAAATPDQTESHGSMRQVAATGRQALAELRLVLSVLHPPEPDAAPLEARVPQPSLAALPQLAQDVRRAGLLVDLRVDEAAGQLPEALQATVFRIVQESLTNTLKHADHPTGSQVQVEVRGDEVIVAIQDDGRQATVGPRGDRRKRHPRDARTGRDVRRLDHGRRRDGWLDRDRHPGPCRRQAPVIRVLVVDDQPLIRAGFRMVLNATDDLRVDGEASDGFEAVRMARELAPDVVVMDVRMPGLDGVEATRRITEASTAKVLILTTFDLDQYAFEGLRNGASGFLLKDVPPEVLCDAVRAVAEGDAVLTPRITREFVNRYASKPVPVPAEQPISPELQRLTQREREVLDVVAAGLTNAQIAERLRISEATVKTHITRILAKLGLRDRVQAVIYAYEHGLRRTDR